MNKQEGFMVLTRGNSDTVKCLCLCGLVQTHTVGIPDCQLLSRCCQRPGRYGFLAPDQHSFGPYGSSRRVKFGPRIKFQAQKHQNQTGSLQDFTPKAQGVWPPRTLRTDLQRFCEKVTKMMS